MAARERAAAARRPALLALAAVVVGGLAVLALWWVKAPPEAPGPRPVAAVAPGEAVPPPVFAADAGEALPEPIRRWLAATPYPPTSGRLTDAHEDLLRPNRRHERPRPIPDTLDADASRVVTTLLTADRWYYTGDQTVRATLQAWRGGEPLAVELLAARAQPEGSAGPEGPALPLDFLWERDRFVAELPLERVGEHLGPVLLEVRYAYEPGAVHEESLRLFVTPLSRIPARLTGEVRETMQDGSLLLALGVEVEAAGFYRFDANLRDASGGPVAFVSWKGDLARGAREIPLEVYGKVLRDAGVPGPWTLREIRGYRFLEASYPDRERLPDSELAFTTRAWPLEGFVDAPHTSAHELHMVELMKADLARGLTLDVPAPPAPGVPVGERPPDDGELVAVEEAPEAPPTPPAEVARP